VLGVRNPADAKVMTLARESKAEVKLMAEAVQAADLVVLALPWGAAEGAVKALGGLKGKIVIDCMNPLAMQNGKLGLDRGFSTSGAETLASWIPDALIVKTLNQVGAEMMADNADLPHRPVMFMAGNDRAAKEDGVGPAVGHRVRAARRRRPDQGAPARALCHGLDQSGARPRQRTRLGVCSDRPDVSTQSCPSRSAAVWSHRGMSLEPPMQDPQLRAPARELRLAFATNGRRQNPPPARDPAQNFP
jgi:hypothetical protein